MYTYIGAGTSCLYGILAILVPWWALMRVYSCWHLRTGRPRVRIYVDRERARKEKSYILLLSAYASPYYSHAGKTGECVCRPPEYVQR